ncbi:hypothetical protein E6C27_scaffold36G001540 [Cucumis melo var. makuwa]|uniref:Uncharacterized protein n=3 Tax=Cucumis melo var. makuwa TaxID=1194695 RepID=A0A5A7T3Q5_CUCMM|nr:hypothetical protein E6C27_scaffold36G001540 [Cucumis melo var. makuwa]
MLGQLMAGKLRPRRVQPIKPSRTRAAPAPSRAAPATEPSQSLLFQPNQAESIPTFWSHTDFGRSPRSLGPAAWKAHLFSLLEFANTMPEINVSMMQMTIWLYYSMLCVARAVMASNMDIDMTRVTRRGPRIPTVLGVPRGTEDQSYVPTGAHVARVRERARDWVEDEARAKASWRATRSDRGGP